MLLRRVMEHVKTQNWFAVGIDFIIVVVGVFIGLQVQEWSSERAFDARERAYLAELAAEIEANNVMSTGRHELMMIVVEAGKRAIAFQQGGVPCTDDCVGGLVDYFHASQVLYGPPERTVYEEMLRVGLPRARAVKSTVSAYYRFDKILTSSIDTDPEYRNKIRGYFPPHIQALLWRNCHRVDGAMEVLVRDCAPGISDEEARMVLEAIRADANIESQLYYWIGMNEHWARFLDDQVSLGRNAIAVINTEIGRQ